MAVKQHLDQTIKLWHSTILELEGIATFLQIDKVNDQFYRRLIVRGLFSVIETYLNVTKEIIKMKSVVERATNLRWEELVILHGKNVRLDEKGRVSTSDEFYKFESNLRFTLNLFAAAFNADQPEYGAADFQKLKSLVRRRNEITHPKSIEHIVVSDSEVKDIFSAFSWFFGIHSQINVKFVEWLSRVYPTLS